MTIEAQKNNIHNSPQAWLTPPPAGTRFRPLLANWFAEKQLRSDIEARDKLIRPAVLCYSLLGKVTKLKGST